MILPKITYENLKIPQADISNYKYLRIEIGISINSKREKISGKIKSQYKELKLISQLSKISYWKKYIKKITVQEYLISHNIGKSEIDKFFKYVLEANENLLVEDKIIDLAEQQKRSIDIFILTCKNKRILIETSGMYAMVLHLTYLIIKDFIENKKGYCVEIAYPHFNSTEELGLIISNEPKVIQLGEMKII